MCLLELKEGREQGNGQHPCPPSSLRHAQRFYADAEVSVRHSRMLVPKTFPVLRPPAPKEPRSSIGTRRRTACEHRPVIACESVEQSLDEHAKGSRHGIEVVISAPDSRRYPASAPSRRARWSPPSGMRRTSTAADNWRLGWAFAPAALVGREVESAGHEQARRQLPAHLADTRCAIGHLSRRPEGGSVQLGQRGGAAAQQECSNRLGVAGP